MPAIPSLRNSTDPASNEPETPLTDPVRSTAVEFCRLSRSDNAIAVDDAENYHRLVNVIWRTLLTIWRAKWQLRRRGMLEPTVIGRVEIRTLPTDIDFLGHMNNGRYGSLFDLGRFDLLIRTGIWDVFRDRGWYAVVASETITFRKSLDLWQRFTVESRLLGHDDRSAYLMHRAVVDGEVYAEMIVRARFLRRSGGIVPHQELFEALHRPDNLPELEPWVLEWAAASALPSTRATAPSVWG